MGDDERILELHGHPVRVRGYDDIDVVGGMVSATVPFNDLVGLRWELISPDRVEASLVIGPDHLQPSGVVHGGVYCTLVEAVGSTGSVAHVAAKGQLAMGVHNATSFVRPTTFGAVDRRRHGDPPGPHPAPVGRAHQPRRRSARSQGRAADRGHG